MNKSDIRGVIAAVPTPIEKNGRPDRALFREHANWVLDQGCDGLNILGTTGEANSLDSYARIKLMEWAAEDFTDTPLMVGTGTPSVTETARLTIKADDLGYRTALVLPPYYYKPASDQGLIAWYDALDKVLGEREIRIFFYNFPQMTGFQIPLSVIETLHARNPARFAGIKDSSGDPEYALSIARAMPDMAVFPGSEVNLHRTDEMGFAGCISATVNVTAALAAQLFARGADADSSLIETLTAMRTRLTGPTLIPSVKYVTAQRTQNPEWQRVVPPLEGLTESRRAEIDAMFAATQ